MVYLIFAMTLYLLPPAGDEVSVDTEARTRAAWLVHLLPGPHELRLVTFS
jgi:hypothetical protein